MESPISIYLAYNIGFYSDLDIVEWAVAYFPNNEHFSDDEQLIEIVSINTKQPREVENAGKILEKFIFKIWPEFSFDSEKTEIYAKRYFKKRLNEYLEGKCEPYDVCKMINPIEDILHFPSWLGDMYNACDWIEPGDKLNGKQSRYFNNEVKETLKRLKKL